MKVKLLSVTPDPIDVMWTAARTCYASESPIDIWNSINPLNSDEVSAKQWKLVQQVLHSGHQSIAEHVTFTFAIEGISRACSHQLVRHRAGIVFSQQSQRYVEIKERFEEVRDLLAVCDDDSRYYVEEKEEEAKSKIIKILDKYFVDVNEDNYLGYAHSLREYLRATDWEVKPEDARKFLPNATKTNITVSCNYRELIHMCHLRLCTRAQKEIRDVFKEIVKQLKEQDERLVKYLVPQCEAKGFCEEHRCCGRKPTLKQIMEGYNKWKQFKDVIDEIAQQCHEQEILSKCGVELDK